MKVSHHRIGMIDDAETEIYSTAHERHPKSVHCKWCDMLRLVQIQEEFLWRLDNCGEVVDHLNMWSLGSSLKASQLNEKVIIRDWHLFRARMAKRGNWKPVFRILEKGRRGYLHIHFVSLVFIEHAVVMDAWRSVRGETANVHVSGQKGAQDPARMCRYLMKYLTKENTSYRWLGPFYGLHRARSRRVTTGEKSIKYGGIMYGGFDSTIIEPIPSDVQQEVDNFRGHPGEVNKNG